MENLYTLTLTQTLLASTYSCASYGGGSYNESGACEKTTATGTGTAAGGGKLVDTGYNVYLPLAAGILLVVAAIAIIVTTMKKRHSAAQN